MTNETKKTSNRTAEQKAEHARKEKERRARIKAAKLAALGTTPTNEARPLGTPKAAKKSTTKKSDAPKPTPKPVATKNETTAAPKTPKPPREKKTDGETSPHPKALALALAEERGFGLTVRTVDHAKVRVIASAPDGQIFAETSSAKREFNIERRGDDRSRWLADRRSFWGDVLAELKSAKLAAKK